MFCCCCCCIPGIPIPDCSDCCSNEKDKLKIPYSICNVIIIIFLIATMSIINWGKFPKVNISLFIIIFIFMFILTVIGLLFCYWTKDENIKSEMINAIKIIANIALFLSITVYSVKL